MRKTETKVFLKLAKPDKTLVLPPPRGLNSKVGELERKEKNRDFGYEASMLLYGCKRISTSKPRRRF